jgi:hypothetical protein
MTDTKLCDDCPPEGYPTDWPRCAECPRRVNTKERFYAKPIQYSIECEIWLDKEGTTGVKYFDCLIAHAEEVLDALNRPSVVDGELIEELHTVTNCGPGLMNEKEQIAHLKGLCKQAAVALTTKPVGVVISRDCAGIARDSIKGQLIAEKAIVHEHCKSTEKAFNELHVAIKNYDQALKDSQ